MICQALLTARTDRPFGYLNLGLPKLASDFNMDGKLTAAVEEGIATELPMADCQFQQFSDQIRGFGTQNLRSCSVPLIASPHGAILAHIPALGDTNVHTMMDQFSALYQLHRASSFPLSSEIWLAMGITMEKNGKLTDILEDQTRIISSRLIGMGLGNFGQAIYTFHLQPADQSPTFPGKGSVFVDTSLGQLTIYVEDNPVNLG